MRSSCPKCTRTAISYWCNPLCVKFISHLAFKCHTWQHFAGVRPPRTHILATIFFFFFKQGFPEASGVNLNSCHLASHFQIWFDCHFSQVFKEKKNIISLIWIGIYINSIFIFFITPYLIPYFVAVMTAICFSSHSNIDFSTEFNSFNVTEAVIRIFFSCLLSSFSFTVMLFSGGCTVCDYSSGRMSKLTIELITCTLKPYRGQIISFHTKTQRQKLYRRKSQESLTKTYLSWIVMTASL